MATLLSKRCDNPEELLQAILNVEKDGIATFEIQKHCDHYTLYYFLPVKKEKWDGRCQCGHLHSEHGPTGSINYTAGRCHVGECRCAHFIHKP